MTDKIVVREGESTGLPIETGTGSIERLLDKAVEHNLSVEALEKLVALHERVMTRNAAMEFADAMASFQAECPSVPKTSTAKVVTKNGGAYSYQYAELDEIARTVRPLLHKHGLSYTWDSALSDDGQRIKVVCTVSHANGHRATASFESPTEALTQAMSPQQKHAAALTFARRQSLIQALGLTTCDPDDDGRDEPEALVTPDQVLILEALIDKRPDGTRGKILAYFGIESLEQMSVSRFEWLKNDLEQKIRSAK